MSINSQIQELIQQSKNLENHVISSLGTATSDVEIILKELLVYLNSTSQGLIQIQSQIDEIKEPIKDINSILEKSESIDKNIKEMPEDFKKMISDKQIETNDSIKKILDPVRSVLNKMIQYIKLMSSAIKDQSKKNVQQNEILNNISISMEFLSKDLKSTKDEILLNQDGLYKVIDSILKSKSFIDQASLDFKSKQLDNETDMQKKKINLWLKIIGYLVGSSGIIYFIFDLIFEGI